MIFENIQVGLAIGARELERLIDTAPARYKVYEIAKRSTGTRTIAQPAREIKYLQYYLMENLLQSLPVHELATAYVKGTGIAYNANLHKDNKIMLKLDFVNFFNSIVPRDLDRVLSSTGTKYSSIDRFVLKKILFWGMKSKTPICLSVGAPTSPMISNIVMYDIDVAMKKAADKLGVVVSRYADDITVSANSLIPLLGFEKFLEKLLFRTASPKLALNEKKRGTYTNGQRRLVTGLIITPDSNVSIGRARKREISVLIHRASLNKLTAEEINYLKGYLAFAASVESDFALRMRRKYGDELLDYITTYDSRPPDIN